MTIEEIKAALADLVRHMTEKGLQSPRAQYEIKAAETSYIYLKADGTFRGKYDFAFSRSDDPAEALAMAADIIAAIPTVEDRDRREFLTKVSDAAEHGRKIGLDHETYIAPLRGVAQAISENLLTKE